MKRRIEKAKAQVRASVEHPFRAIKRQFGYTKVRFRGLVEIHDNFRPSLSPTKSGKYAMNAVQIALLGSGLFYITGMLTGLRKYRCMMSSADTQTPVYVDIFHRTTLMYPLSCLILVEFAQRNVWSEMVNQLVVVVPIFFFAAAVASYAIHGTDNQLRRPHALGAQHVNSSVGSVFTVLLAVGEIGGFFVLFAGWLRSLWVI